VDVSIRFDQSSGAGDYSLRGGYSGEFHGDKMLGYFDLNQRTKSAFKKEAEAKGMLGDKPLSLWRQLLLYFGVLVGVVFSSAVDKFKAGENIAISFSPIVLLVAAVVALMLVPLVYQKLAVQPNSPLIVQLGLFVQSGVFWHTIVSTIAKAR
jgi:hypothetical protein